MNEIRRYNRKLRQETRIVADPGFPQPGPQHYLPYLERLHIELKPEVYFEIGTESGASLNFARCTSIAVDPAFQLQSDVSRNKPELHLYQGTSDAFFATRLIERLGLKIDLAFLDGMHWYEFLLRDFINTERLMQPGGLVLMHDCLPFNHLVAERDWDQTKTASWTGDVWKIIPILRRWRPDLEISVLDAAPTGLVAVRGLDPANRVLETAYDEILREFDAVTLADYGVERFTGEAALVPCAVYLPVKVPPVQVPQALGPVPARAAARAGVRIKIAAPPAEAGEFWGEHAFADGLAAAFRRKGHEVRVDTPRDWPGGRHEDEIDVVVRGHNFRRKVYLPAPEARSLLWLIYTPWPDLTEDELAAFGHVAVASEPYLHRLAGRVPADRLSLLPQAFDADRMRPLEGGPGKGVVYVANNPEKAGLQRRMAGWLAETGASALVWGKRWADTPLAPMVVAEHVENSALGEVYGRAAVVLNDHVGAMGDDGFPSNRLFDVLACGVPVLSDPVAWLPPDMAEYVAAAADGEGFRTALAELLAEGPARRAARRRFADDMLARHSFDARAGEILERASRPTGTTAPDRRG